MKLSGAKDTRYSENLIKNDLRYADQIDRIVVDMQEFGRHRKIHPDTQKSIQLIRRCLGFESFGLEFYVSNNALPEPLGKAYRDFGRGEVSSPTEAMKAAFDANLGYITYVKENVGAGTLVKLLNSGMYGDKHKIVPRRPDGRIGNGWSAKERFDHVTSALSSISADLYILDLMVHTLDESGLRTLPVNLWPGDPLSMETYKGTLDFIKIFREAAVKVYPTFAGRYTEILKGYDGGLSPQTAWSVQDHMIEALRELEQGARR